MSDNAYREPHVPHVDVKLVMMILDNNPNDRASAEKQIQNLMNEGYLIEAHSAVCSDNRSPRFVWTMVRRIT